MKQSFKNAYETPESEVIRIMVHQSLLQPSLGVSEGGSGSDNGNED